jgi:adenylate cyclase
MTAGTSRTAASPGGWLRSRLGRLRTAWRRIIAVMFSPVLFRLAWLGGKLANTRKRLIQALQQIPLVYKLSLLITVLVVTCMALLGSIIIQQQTRLFADQLHDQGTALVKLMAHSAKEPLLADDQLAMDVITTGFTDTSNVIASALISLDGETLAHAGNYHDGNNNRQRGVQLELINEAPGFQDWYWPGPSISSVHKVISFIHPIVFQDVTVGYALSTISQSTMEESLRKAIQAIAGATLLIIMLGIAMAIALGRRISDPINQLVIASRAIGKGEFTGKFSFRERRSDELGQLMASFNHMAEGMLEKSQVMQALSRYVSPEVAKVVLANLNDIELGGKQVEGTVVFADIVEFTRIAENTRPEDLVNILNSYFTLITRACEINHGTVDKYMGDGVMLVFGAPQPDEEHRFHAINCAVLIQQLVEHENRQREQQGLFPVKFRIGINSGTMLAGNMGSRERMEYTVVGDTVNLASRLCGIANSGQIVISRSLYMNTDVRERVLAGEYQAIRLRGIKDPVSTYLVETVTAGWQYQIEEQFRAVTRPEQDKRHDPQVS